jgi:hypothetical protein
MFDYDPVGECCNLAIAARTFFHISSSTPSSLQQV